MVQANIYMLSKWGRRFLKNISKKRGKKKPEVPKDMRWNIVRGDNVEVINGVHEGQRGKILAVIRKNCRVIVEGVNLRNRVVKSKMPGAPGKRIVRPCSIHYSNVMLIDPIDNKPTKINRRWTADGEKVRVSKRTGHIIPKPNPMTFRVPRTTLIGKKDTLPEEVFKVTFSDYVKYLPYIYARANVEGIDVQITPTPNEGNEN